MALAPVASGYVFLSYSSLDRAYVGRLHDAVASAEVPCWFDQEIPNGARWDHVLRERIDACSSLVVVMSPTAMQSPWVRLEVGRALARGRSVHPILLAGERFDWLAGWQYDRVNDVQVLPPRLLDELRYDLAAPATASVAAGPARLVGRGFPLPNPYFVGRADQLLDLESRLYWGPAMAVQALHGTGGVGKTQLAAQYAHQRRDDYDLIAWIDAEQPDDIPVQFAELAEPLGLEVPVGAPADMVLPRVLAALAASRLRWLLVFDKGAVRRMRRGGARRQCGRWRADQSGSACCAGRPARSRSSWRLRAGGSWPKTYLISAGLCLIGLFLIAVSRPTGQPQPVPLSGNRARRRVTELGVECRRFTMCGSDHSTHL